MQWAPNDASMLQRSVGQKRILTQIAAQGHSRSFILQSVTDRQGVACRHIILLSSTPLPRTIHIKFSHRHLSLRTVPLCSPHNGSATTACASTPQNPKLLCLAHLDACSPFQPVNRYFCRILEVLSLKDKVTTLGVILHSNLTLDAHVSAMCKNAHFHLRALRHIRSFHTDDMATSIAVAHIHSRLDYANSLLYGISVSNIHKLQRRQNMAARLILQQS